MRIPRLRVTVTLDTLVDVGMALLMAAAAVMTTWATYEGSQWDGQAAADRSQSAILRSDSTRAAADAVTQSVVDASVWLEWEKAVTLNRDEFAGFLRDRFSPALDAAQDAWFGRALLDADGNPVDGRLPKGTPLALDAYVPTAQLRAEDFAAQAEAKLSAADQASSISGEYVLQAVLLAMVLFFASVATKFTNLRLQVGLALVSLALLAVVAIRLGTLPIL